jgi:hypothetical protein
MVEERGELLLLPLPCGSPYAASAWVTRARLCARCAVDRVPLVPGLPTTPPGRGALWLRHYYAGVRLLGRAQRLRLLTFPLRTIRPQQGLWPIQSLRFPHRSVRTCQGLRPRRVRWARNNAPADFAFRQVNNVGNRVDNGFAAQWLALYALPTLRQRLADACARIGGDVVATLHRSGLSPHTLCQSPGAPTRCGSHTRAATNS